MEEYRHLWSKSPTTELGKVVHLDLPKPFTMQYGGQLPSIQISYESWGRLNERGDNAVLIVHPLTTDCHATGEFDGQPPGWWEPLIGPGRPIDSRRYYVVCPNLVGGCYGTTGPRFPASDGKPYLDRFPLVTPRDMMRVQRLLIDALGVRRLNMVLGPSMGGMIAWEWAIEESAVVDRAVIVAAPLRTSPYQIGLNWLQRRGIELGLADTDVEGKIAFSMARGVGMMSYRSPTGLDAKFGRTWFTEPGPTLSEPGLYNVESWLHHHGRRLRKRFDPYTYLLYARAMDLHDAGAGRDLPRALSQMTSQVLVIGISSDQLYPCDDVRRGADLVQQATHRTRYAEIDSANGHDAFLLDTDQIGSMLRDFVAGGPE